MSSSASNSGQGSSSGTGKVLSKKKLSPISIAHNSVYQGISKLKDVILQTTEDPANVGRLEVCKNHIEMDLAILNIIK